jgi:hypothetical protein
MSDAELYCENCDSVMAPGWSLPYCPMCGGKIGPKNFDKPEKNEMDAPAESANPDGDKEEGNNADRFRAEAFDDLRQASPAGIFIADLLTFGLRSTFRLSRWMGSLECMARQDERHGRMVLYACFIVYIAIIALMAFACREIYSASAGWDFSLLGKLIFPRVAAGLFIILFLMNRHILFWAREVIADAIQRENSDTINTKAESFAPSPFLLWFIGVPYLQSHLNEIVRARNLANFKASKRRTP